MRWVPDGPTCVECGFDWATPVPDAIALVAGCPERYADLLAGQVPAGPFEDGRWSASMYLWHVVDVLRIGTERLWTVELDAERGVFCWDENGLAAARHYSELSVVVGLHALGQGAAAWVATALATPPELGTNHDRFGELSVADIVRRNAHEVHHHQLDITRDVG